MYLSFYGLDRQPFHITPDPSFLYLSPSHQGALAAIADCVRERKGLIAITGDVGVGKTTILRTYIETRRSEGLKVVYLFNPTVSFEGLLKTICRDLELPIASDSTANVLDGLHEFLLEEERRGASVVLIVDEAQNMPLDTLESVCTMLNWGSPGDKLMQVVLVGQPEFKKALDTRRLKRQIAVRATIRTLSKSERLEYLKFRLRQAGGDPASVFTSQAIREIGRRSKGIPRVLNILCDNALFTGFYHQQKPVAKRIAQETGREFAGRPLFVRRRLSRAAALILLPLFGIAPFLPRA